jgi:hypothetical protein
MVINPNYPFKASEVMPWERLDPPVFWAAFGAEVIADRHLPDGTRQHVVRGTVPKGTVVANVQVFGEDDLLPNAI